MINSEISNLAGSAGETKARTEIAMPEFNQESIFIYLQEYLSKDPDRPIEESAILLGVSKSTLYDIINEKPVGERSLFRLAKALGLKISVEKPDNQ